MTFLEAVTAIEKKTESLRVRYRDGTPMAPIVALGKVGKYHGARFNFWIDAMDRQDIEVDEYYLEMMKMLIEYSNRPERTQEYEQNSLPTGRPGAD